MDRAGGVQPAASICIHVRTPERQTWDASGRPRWRTRGGAARARAVGRGEGHELCAGELVLDFWVCCFRIEAEGEVVSFAKVRLCVGLNFGLQV